jgi:hypothetical protein
VASDLDRIDELLDGQEADFRAAFIRYVQLIRSPAVMAEIEDHLSVGDVNGAFQIVRSHIETMAGVLPQIHQAIGAETALELQRVIGATALAISFDATDPAAAALVRTQRLELIRDFSTSQYEAVDQAVRRALLQGQGAAGLARSFRGAIGLTAQQESYVESYRRVVETNSTAALDRALRDRRFDDRVARAIESEKPLPQRTIDAMVNRYRDLAIAARAETIARSEAGRASAEARDEALRQMTVQTGIRPDRIERIWNATRDKRVRDWHASMQGQARAMEGPFLDGKGNQLMRPHDPSAPAETTINCRCVVTFRVRPLV